MENELLPCPFCGGEVDTAFGFSRAVATVEPANWFRCGTCGARTANYISNAEAITAWNRRSPIAPLLTDADLAAAYAAEDRRRVAEVGGEGVDVAYQGDDGKMHRVEWSEIEALYGSDPEREGRSADEIIYLARRIDTLRGDVRRGMDAIWGSIKAANDRLHEIDQELESLHRNQSDFELHRGRTEERLDDLETASMAHGADINSYKYRLEALEESAASLSGTLAYYADRFEGGEARAAGPTGEED